VPEQTPSFSNQFQRRVSTIERRDWELWATTLAIVAILSVGYFWVMFPAVFMKQHTLSFQASMSPQLIIGQLTLVLLFLIYVIQKHIQVRRLRAQSLSEALNYQLMQSQMLLDPLTRVFNRSVLEELLGKVIKHVQRKKLTAAFLYIDINDFKKVNTSLGHLSGDLVLTELGAILKACVRGSDYLIRMGGDEFLAILVDTDQPGAEAVKQRINQQTQKWNGESPLKNFTLTLSVGIHVIDDTCSFDEVLSSVDSKMYEEKAIYQAKDGQ
jgi:diguanylate cyclase (GGDEF)-like protein